MQFQPLRLVAGLALVALVPVVLYLTNRSEPIVGFSVVSVFIIAASLYMMFGPSEAEQAAGH